MSKSIDERIVQMRFDNKQFENGVQTTLSTLDKLKQGLKLDSASKGLENVTAAAKNCDMSGVAKAVETISVKFSAMEVMAITALQNITNSALYYGKRIISALTVDPINTGLKEYEIKMNSIQVIQSNTRGVNTMDEIVAALDELNAYADKTIYNFAQMTSNIGKFTAQGLDVYAATKAVQGMANLAAASGASAEDMSRATYQMSQALSGTIRKIDWNSLRNANMATQTLKNILTDIAQIEDGIDVGAMIAEKGTFEDTLELGWLSGDLFTRAMNVYSGVYTEAELIAKGYTNEQIKNFQDIAKTAESAATEVKTITQLWDVLKETAQSGWTQTWEYVIGDFESAKKTLTKAQVYLSDMINASADARNSVMKAWSEAGGRDDLIQSLVNVFQGLLSVVKPIKEAFRDIFPSMTAERLVGITSALKNFTERLKLSETTADNLKRTFKGAFAVLDIGVQIFKALGSGLADLIKYILPVGDGLLGMTGNLGDFLVGIDETIKNTDVFGKAVKKITETIKLLGDFLKTIRDRVVDFAKKLQQKFDFHPFELFHNILERVQIRMTDIGEAAGDMKSVFVVAITAMGNALENCKFLQLFSALWKGVKTIVGGIISVLGSFAGGIAEKIGNADFNGVFDIINSLLAGGIGVGIYKFIDTLNNVSEIAGSFKESILNILGGLKDCLSEYQKSLKAKTLITIAGAIGILAASLLVISLIDSRKLTASLGAITAMFADLVASIAILEKVGNLGAVGKITTTMVGMSISVLILSSALKKIGSLDFDDMLTGLVGVVGLIATVTGAMILLGKFAQNGVKGATQMVILSAALAILADVLIDISGLSLTEIGKGLLGVLALMSTLVASMILLSEFAQKGVKGATSMLILSSAVKVLASVLKDIGTLDLKTIGKGLLSVVSLMGTLTGAMILVSNFAKSGVKGATQMVIISAAIVILSNVLKDLGTLNLEVIGKGLLSIIGLLGSLVGAMVLLSKFATSAASMLAAGVSTVLVAAAIEILADAVSKFGKMDLPVIIQGLIGIGVMLLELAVALKAVQGTLGGAAALLVLSTALLALTPTLSILGAMPVMNIVKALATLAGVFIILGVAGAVLSGVVPAILGLSAAFTLIGVGVLGFSAGLLLAGLGLTAIAAGLTALSVALTGGATAIAAGLTVIVSGIIGLIPAIVEKFGEGIITFCRVIANGAPAIGAAVKTLILTAIDVIVECVPEITEGLLKVLDKVLEAMVTYGPQIVSSIMQFLIGILNEIANHLPELIVAAVNVIMAFFQGVVDALSGIDTDTLLKGIVGVGLLSGIMAALSAVGSLIPGAMVGVLGMGAVIAELALVLAAIGALAQIPGLTWLVGEGGDLMQLVGNAIGSFIGGIVGGIMEGVTSSFPNIGTDLSAFMTNIQPFIEGAKAIDPKTLEGVRALAETILILTAANILDGLTSWLTGGSSMTKFAEELVPFGQSMKEYGAVIAGLDGDTVAASATAALTLAEFAAKLPNSGGLMSHITGENSITKFAEELVPFGESMMAYSHAVSGLDTEVITASATAALSLAELASKLPNSGGLAGWFAGENDMNLFGEQLIPFGESLKEYSLAVSGIDPDVITASATAALSLAELASKLPNSGGLAGWFAGENDMDDFGEQLVPFGEGLKKYSLAVSGLDANAITNSTVAAKALSELASNLPNSGGLVSWFTGDNDISKFGESLVSFGEDFASYSNYMKNVDSAIVKATTNAANSIVELQKSLPKEGGWFSDNTTLTEFGNDMNTFGQFFAAYYAYISKVDPDQLGKAVVEIGKLIDLAGDMSGLDTSGMSGFGLALYELGKSGITEFVSAFTNSSKEVQTSITTMMSYVSNSIKDNQQTCVDEMTALADSLVMVIKNTYKYFYTAGSTMITYLIDGIKAEDPDAKTAYTNLIDGIITAMKETYTDYYSVGTYLTQGFISGVKSKYSKAASTYTEILSNAVGEMKKLHSDFYKSGMYLAQALISGTVDKNEEITSNYTKSMDAAITVIRGRYSDFYSAGSYLVQGFIGGISNNIQRAAEESAAMANAAITAARTELDEHSPSKVGYEIGDFFGVAFVNAIADYGKRAYDTSKNVASMAKSGLTAAVSQIADYIDSDMDTQPTIRPVLDLSEVENGAKRLNTMFSYSQALTAGNGITSYRRYSDEENQNGANSSNGNTFTFTQNNYSPKALSRVEIYRQTKNQFSALERMVEA